MDVGTLDAGQPFMVMEYLEGCDLAQLLERTGPLNVVSAVDFLLQALEALAHAHALHLVHRDLKPANLFLARQQDGSDVVKVLDFGISKATNGPGGTNPSLTSTKALLGSPLYMSPEQLRSSKNVDPRTDIWALGVILYELLTAQTPYNGDNVGELFASILEKDAPPVRLIRPDVPPGVEQAVLRCLCRDPSKRFADVGQLADALAPFGSAHGGISAEKVRRSFATLGGGSKSIPPGAAVALGPAGGAGARASQPGVRTAGGTVITGGVPGRQTAAAWGEGDAGIPVKTGLGAGALIGIAGTFVVIGFAAVALVMHHGTDATPGQSVASTPASAPAPSDTSAPPAAAPPATGAAPADSAPSAPSPSTTPAPSALPSAAPAAPPPVAQPAVPRVGPVGPAATAKKLGPAHKPGPSSTYDPTKDTSAQ
jgi:serine/threonine-protein kinase